MNCSVCQYREPVGITDNSRDQRAHRRPQGSFIPIEAQESGDTANIIRPSLYACPNCGTVRIKINLIKRDSA